MNDGLIHFRCPVCQFRMSTLPANMEHQLDCPSCETRIMIPFVPADTAATEVVLGEEVPLEFRARQQREDAELDMTPMVDVTFLLLIFFMVTAAFALQKSFKLPTPDAKVPSTNFQQDLEDEVVIVRVDEFNTFLISSTFSDEEIEAPNEQELLRRLREAKSGGGRGTIQSLIVEADGEAEHAAVIKAMDAGNEIGFENIRLRTLGDTGDS